MFYIKIHGKIWGNSVRLSAKIDFAEDDFFMSAYDVGL